MSEERSPAERILQLEEIVSHQEHLLRQLNDVVLQMRADHDRLQNQFQRQFEHLSQRMETLSQPDLPDEKPPHY